MDRTLTGWQDYQSFTAYRQHTVVGNVNVLPAVWSPQLNNHRDILVYLPPSYEASVQPYPVIYMHDGQNLFDRATSYAGQEWQVDETMEDLSRDGLEAIVVGIPHMGASRVQEYNPYPAFRDGRGESYLDFITDTLKPMIDRQFRTQAGREQTGLIGSSMGGLISLYGFFHRPQAFGFAGVMSPALWIAGGAIYEDVESQPFVPGKIYLDNGTRESSARKMNAILSEKGYATN
ncbi:MAG: alpha/beta hydrolase, partial [Anaerolineae bacterium]|nr:alpha/beta hydrolase [Anaerolineae bacterium]